MTVDLGVTRTISGPGSISGTTVTFLNAAGKSSTITDSKDLSS